MMLLLYILLGSLAFSYYLLVLFCGRASKIRFLDMIREWGWLGNSSAWHCWCSGFLIGIRYSVLVTLSCMEIITEHLKTCFHCVFELKRLGMASASCACAMWLSICRGIAARCNPKADFTHPNREVCRAMKFDKRKSTVTVGENNLGAFF